MGKSSNEETSEPLIADARNYYKVEKSTKDGTKVDPFFRYSGCAPCAWAAGLVCRGRRPAARAAWQSGGRTVGLTCSMPEAAWIKRARFSQRRSTIGRASG